MINLNIRALCERKASKFWILLIIKMLPGYFYLHIGLHKTATTWFQKEVYPKFSGASYLDNPPIHKLIALSRRKRYILCEESLLRHLHGRSYEQNIPFLSRLFPDAQVILLIRRQDSWLGSAYNHFIKSGGCLPFDKFFDLEGDTGLVKRKDLFFHSIISALNSAFPNSQTWVIPYEDLRNDPLSIIEKLAFRMECSVDLHALDLKPKNASISDRSVNVLLSWNRYIRSERNPSGHILLRRSWLKKFGMPPEKLVQLPAVSCFGRANPLINPKIRTSIQEFYADDWEKCISYVDSIWGGAGTTPQYSEPVLMRSRYPL